MKKYVLAIVALSATIAMSAQTSEVSVSDAATTEKGYQHHFGIGVRGGISGSLQTFGGDLLVWNGRNHIGAVAALDLEYTFLSKLKTNSKVLLGVRSGLSAVYSYNYLTATTMVDQYNVTDNESKLNTILYTVSAQNFREDQSQVMVELPVLLALRTLDGFVFYTGLKFNMPVYGWYKSNYKNPDITAYYTELGVEERNQKVTGVLTEMAPQVDTKLRIPWLNVLWNVELGYEWTLKNGDGLALTVYGDAPLLSMNQRVSPNYCHFIQVGAPKAGGPEIYTNSISNSNGRYMSFMDFGLKLTYDFSFKGRK